jgi:recombination protein RecT
MSTEIAKTKPAKLQLKEMLTGDSFRAEVAKSLPKHLPPERFIRIAVTAINRIPQLAECDQHSFFKALIDLSSYGLEPDGRLAHLIPFKNKKKNIVECQLIIDYKGLAVLAMRSGIISTLHADVVCENDEFEYDLGEVKRHKINFRKPRGEPYAAYSVAKMKDGGVFCQVMSKEEIEKIRNNSQGYKAAQQYGSDSIWTGESKDEMWKKTPFRRMCKWLPLSAEFRDAVATQDDDSFEARSESARRVAPVEYELPENPLEAIEQPKQAATVATSEAREGELV